MNMKRESSMSLYYGSTDQIPSLAEIFSNLPLFVKHLAMYHFFKLEFVKLEFDMELEFVKLEFDMELEFQKLEFQKNAMEAPANLDYFN